MSWSMFPFLKNAKKSKKWAHGGNLLTMLLYLLIMVVSLAYFTTDHITRLYWPTLTMWKSVELPFVERFEYVGISSWGLIILPSICLAFWAASRGARQLFRVSQRHALIIILIITFISNIFLTSKNQIEQLTTYYSYISFYLLIVYVPLLFIVVYFRLGRRKQS
ncbi:GerAB/ArcD/ProY family transporter [Piscibacillus halophilus]|uniref:GerAB/ArcD/ProY family transporter n=1 Tax=Piscibacillus halophilus TaxID=571933 RepID=UPI00158C5A71|nr:GerAB/ArcD/ProY family transporter [Piscibacillus halophilus]